MCSERVRSFCTTGISLGKTEYISRQMHLWSVEDFDATIFSGVRVTRSFALCVCFVDRCLSFYFCPLCYLSFDLPILITPLISFDHCVVCPMIYRF